MIHLFCPSRGRPSDANALFRTFRQTKTLPTTRLIFCVDSDDQWQDYPPSILVGPPTGDPTGPLNRAALASEASVVGFIGDDSRFVTKGWDALVERSLREPGFVWASDGHQIPWPSTVFISCEIVQALGYMVPPTLKRGYFDVFWVDLAEATGTKNVIDALIPHDNSAGDPNSKNYKPERRVPPDIIKSDELAFNEWALNQKAADVKKVKTKLALSKFF